MLEGAREGLLLDEDLLVVVDVQLRIRIRLSCRFERNPDEVLAKNVVEDTRTEATVLIKHLIDHVPRIDLALPTSEQSVDVVLYHCGQGGLVPNL